MGLKDLSWLTFSLTFVRKGLEVTEIAIKEAFLPRACATTFSLPGRYLISKSNLWSVYIHIL